MLSPYVSSRPELLLLCLLFNTYCNASVPTNCSFEIDDLEKEWTWTKNFDFIHCRFMNAAFADWPAVIRQAYEYVVNGEISPGSLITYYSAFMRPTGASEVSR